MCILGSLFIGTVLAQLLLSLTVGDVEGPRFFFFLCVCVCV